MAVGILGLGLYHPQQTRTNDWWPQAVIQNWLQEKEKINQGLEQLAKYVKEMPPEAGLILQGLDASKNDIFDGCKNRYIMEEREDCVQMEISAAKEAIEHAGLKPQNIDFIISQSTLPNSLCETNGFFVHKALNLSASCMVYGVAGMCNAFLMQLILGRSLIENGVHKKGLLIQSSGMSRLLDYTKKSSTLYGDIATAVVIGETDFGILSSATSTYTKISPLMAIGVPQKCWYDTGKLEVYEQDASVGFNTCLWSVQQSKCLTEQALNNTSLSIDDIQFFATNQGNLWFRSTTQNLIGLKNAHYVDTFQDYGGLIACNVPVSLYLGYKNNLIKKGDNMVFYTPGSGLQALSLIISSAI
ncbi:3-oxoacyl-ACP synthase III family protein [Legionella septentrionalis]|uniref:3-oxoacyl-ACP synthase III family protein n=1 Tax=Legionella septentrionalis TaxID=2498109 RepID=UPI000F8DD21C|nr:3-oxoacyl-[acyl-carrier-protein] synthase III C-terminal domain-containing protein [Legionella septentrionalis]RUQ94635.1 hypothetical protein ELY11_10895 [Legionella septentrionalis]